MKTIGVYAGSFDPFTYGHLGVVRQAAGLFDKVEILITKNAVKTKRLNPEDMRRLIEEVLESEKLTNVTVSIDDAATARHAKVVHASFLIRGLRNETDYQYEETMATVNQQLTGVKTVYFRADEDVACVSSSIAMDLLSCGEDVSQYLPPNIIKFLKASWTK
jgi:pantetheine-phosphate adenylyltransferase